MATNQERVNAAIELLREGLAPFVARKTNDREQTPIDSWDVQACLKVMMARWGEVFRKTLGPIERSYVSELLEWRNRWAHQKEFSAEDAERALDSAERLLKSIDAPQADEVGRIRRELRAGHMTSKSTSKSRRRTAAQNDGSGSPEDALRVIRTEHHQSWKNLRKAVRALMDQPHESFGTRNVAASFEEHRSTDAKRDGTATRSAQGHARFDVRKRRACGLAARGHPQGGVATTLTRTAALASSVNSVMPCRI